MGACGKLFCWNGYFSGFLGFDENYFTQSLS